MMDATLGDGVAVLHSYVVGARVEARRTVGPFAYLRPGARAREGAKAGTFVEIKNSDVGAGTKVPHLSYIGDADMGEGSNIGAGNITANYDGRNKHRTTIGDGVRTSVDTTFVAPVTVGDGAYTGAGSVIIDDVPPGALGIARARQTNIEGYAERRAAKSGRCRPSRRRDSYTARQGERAAPRQPAGHIARARVQQAADGRLGPRQPRAGAPDRGQAGGRSRRRHAQDVLQRRGLLPLRGVDARRGRLHRAADLREPAHGAQRERRADGAAADDRRGGRRLRPPRDRRHAVVRLLAAGQEVDGPRSRSRPVSSPARSRARGRTGCWRWTSTPARSRASSRSRWTT